MLKQVKKMHMNRSDIKFNLNNLAEIRKNEKVLLKSEKDLISNYTSILENIPDAVIVTDIEENILFANKQAAVLHGYSNADDFILLNKTNLDIIKESDRSHLEFVTSTVLEIGNLRNIEFISLMKDQSEFYSEYSISSAYNQSGELIGFLKIIRDITIQKMAEEKLHKSELTYRYLYENAMVGIHKTSASTGKIILANKAFYKILGYDLEPNNPLETFISDSINMNDLYNKDRSHKIIDIIKEQGYIKDYEIEWQTIAGNNISVLINASYNEEEDIIDGTIIDITKIVDIEKELRKAKDIAEEAAQLKSEFLTKLSHELKTPLNSILGISQLVLNYHFSKTDITKYITLILRSGKKLLQLINDLLLLSNVAEQDALIEKNRFKLGIVFKDLENMFEVPITEKNLKYEIVIDKSLPEEIFTDYFKLLQVLYNIINNSIKFTEKGYIRIETTYLSDKNLINFSIKDSGCGIPPEKARIIFEPFVQADGSLTRKYSGMGLGLTIAKHFIELLGGKISFESIIDKGTTINFSIKNDIENETNNC